MNDVFALADAESLSDLTVFLSRAKRLDDTAIRVIATAGALAVYAPVLYPRGLLDTSPAVLGLRVLRELDRAEFDRVISPGSLLERTARAESQGPPFAIGMPPGEVRVSWSGIAPPRGGWRRAGDVPADTLAAVAREGAAEIAAALPENVGDHIVQRVRSGVWSRQIDGNPGLVAGAAFAAESLGFLAGSEEIPVFVSGDWMRVSPRRGHVLVRRHSRGV
ncbi:hypothetical protein GCM10027416_14600 [Okibacterium endophyticum]